jgi:hypothetical protein
VSALDVLVIAAWVFVVVLFVLIGVLLRVLGRERRRW